MGKNKIELDLSWKAFLEAIREKYGSEMVFHLESLDFAGTRMILERALAERKPTQKFVQVPA